MGEDSGDMKIIILTSTSNFVMLRAVLNLLTNIFLPALVTTESCVII